MVIASVFAVPGLGALAYDAGVQRDLPLLAGILLISTLVVFVVNIAIELLFGLLDHRVSLSLKGDGQ